MILMLEIIGNIYRNAMLKKDGICFVSKNLIILRLHCIKESYSFQRCLYIINWGKFQNYSRQNVVLTLKKEDANLIQSCYTLPYEINRAPSFNLNAIEACFKTETT